MGKTAKLKKKSTSIRSRAAKRASSPSLNLDKSLTSAKPPAESSNARPSVLAIHQGAGISKKTNRAQSISSKKRRRQEKGVARGELAMDKLEKKVSTSLGRSRVVKQRRAAWEDLNEKIASRRAKSGQTAIEPIEEDVGGIGDVAEVMSVENVPTAVPPMEENMNESPKAGTSDDEEIL
ncbi:MAG: hypothetical protein M1837_004852 [Sclerophora amabilis]|nr:MAG: hypothetical protein M1837_004852 [Sclerophora amabilis]